MNDNDRDLIIALISGTLSPEEAAAAEARIAASPELSAEAALKRFAALRADSFPPRLLRIEGDRPDRLRLLGPHRELQRPDSHHPRHRHPGQRHLLRLCHRR